MMDMPRFERGESKKILEDEDYIFHYLSKKIIRSPKKFSVEQIACDLLHSRDLMNKEETSTIWVVTFVMGNIFS